MKIEPIKIKKLIPPKDDLFKAITKSLKLLEENTIVAVSSKVISINEGNCIPIGIVEKDELIKRESDMYLPREAVAGGHVMHTIKNNLLAPTAGIDESNANGYYILWPKNPDRSAKMLWEFFKFKYKVKNVGVIVVDSHSLMFRRGLTGISLSYFGFVPLRDYRGKNDLFKRKIKISQANIPDSLASAAVFAMGEGSEQTPVALITDLKKIRFINKKYSSKKLYSSFNVSMDEDYYAPFINGVKWEKGGHYEKQLIQ